MRSNILQKFAVVCPRCVTWCRKSTEIFDDAAEAYLGKEPLALVHRVDAPEASNIGLANIAPQGATLDGLQVVALVVEHVAIDVAHLQPRSGLDQFPVHKNRACLFTT